MRGKSASLALIAGGLLCSAGAALSADETVVQRVMRRGTLMFRYDRAAWVSSDDALARLPADRRSEVAGWIVSPSKNGLHVDYFGKAVPDRVVFSVDVIGQTINERRFYSADSEPLLVQPALQMAHALMAARSEMAKHANWRSCASARFNTIVLPPEKDNVTPVYFMTPQTEMGSFPFGGHYEVDVAGDGHVVSARAFSLSCITLSMAAQPSRDKSDALAITHLLDPQPTEVHVFEQFSAGVPLYVITGPHSVWVVENGKVAR